MQPAAQQDAEEELAGLRRLLYDKNVRPIVLLVQPVLHETGQPPDQCCSSQRTAGDSPPVPNRLSWRPAPLDFRDRKAIRHLVKVELSQLRNQDEERQLVRFFHELSCSCMKTYKSEALAFT